MNKKIKVAAPAKINLSLEIIDKLPKGYHSLSSVMQSVSLFDYLTIAVSQIHGENQIILSGNSNKIPYNESNIVYKVLKSYLAKINSKGYKIEIFIEKNIPLEAGLAGGSTDGSAAIAGVNAIMGEALSGKELHEILAAAGSDLNFCLEGGACLLSSRGEVIEEKLPYKKYNIVIVKPKNIAVSTGQCYRDFSAKYFEKKEPFYSKKICEVFSSDFNLKEFSQYLYNDLEKPAFDMHPELSDIKQILLDAGCYGALMSGSGSSIFGIYDGTLNLQTNNAWDIFFVDSVSTGAICV